MAVTKEPNPKSRNENSRRSPMVQKETAGLYTPASGNPKGFVSSTHRDYHDLISRVRQMVIEFLPSGAKVLVVNKGDEELLKFQERKGWHFPCTEAGDYAMHYPPDSAGAIGHLEELRAKGADYIVFPATSFWWLEFYGDFRRHLESRYRIVAREEATCMIFDLGNRKLEFHSQKLVSKMNESENYAEIYQETAPDSRDDEAQSAFWIDPEPGSGRLRSRKARPCSENQGATEQSNTGSIFLVSNDYDVNFELVQLAWEHGQMDKVEEHLAKLVKLYPSDPSVLAETLKFYCSQIEGGRIAAGGPLPELFLNCLEDPAKMKLLAPELQLSVAEALGTVGEVELALLSLKAALGVLDFGSEALQSFTLRLLCGVVPGKSAVPFEDEGCLAAFLTHLGNGFAATNDRFKSEACYHFAIAADNSDWNSAQGAARFNLAFGEIARGNPAGALEHLARITRLGPDKTSAIVWPEQEGTVWPYARFEPTAAFEKLKPPGASWPKVTVITPSLNQASYVEETLLSVLNQNYPALEYIVIDGESTDGTVEVLRRYESRFSSLIVEQDKGQTDAINKGLQLATGDIIMWLNSDDLLGPGALFTVALEFLKENADIIYGFCCEHSRRRFGVINFPSVTAGTFSVECLGDIFNYWLKGHYFYQPEVAFSRRILEKVGGRLDENLHYTMDYEFWLRCAKAGARLAAVKWPVGFFRRHDKQKTTSLDETIIEQARVRDRFVLPEPGPERKREIRHRLQKALSKTRPEISVISTRAAEIFSPSAARDLHEELAASGFLVKFGSELENVKPSEDDLIIVLMHLGKEHEKLRRLREAGYEGAIVGWFWEGHHRVFENYRAAADLDVCIPGHEFAAAYLRSTKYLMGPTLQPLPTECIGREPRPGVPNLCSLDVKGSAEGSKLTMKNAFVRRIRTIIESLNRLASESKTKPRGKVFEVR